MKAAALHAQTREAEAQSNEAQSNADLHNASVALLPSSVALELSYAAAAIALLQPQRSPRQNKLQPGNLITAVHDRHGFNHDGDTISHRSSKNKTQTSVSDQSAAKVTADVIQDMLLPLLSSSHVAHFLPQLTRAIAQLLLLQCQLLSFASSLLQSAAAAACVSSDAAAAPSNVSDSRALGPDTIATQRQTLPPVVAIELLNALLLTASEAISEASNAAEIDNSAAATASEGLDANGHSIESNVS
jgi:hypothetical protein